VAVEASSTVAMRPCPAVKAASESACAEVETLSLMEVDVFGSGMNMER
jgi:hypothetical protein